MDKREKNDAEKRAHFEACDVTILSSVETAALVGFVWWGQTSLYSIKLTESSLRMENLQNVSIEVLAKG